MIGTKLAHYEITSHLGSGGMGDVYQATDSKLGRSVAIKFLPEAFGHDSERVARFEREARVLASLNHSGIAAIYGLEESDGRKFLVMELVEGETLAERIKRGPIRVEESLQIAKQICNALEAAHEKGIIHRDLKPANIKVAPDGTVKILDFGLAKAFQPEASTSGLSESPTLSLAATNAGIILGTAAYMSPEQAKGWAVDKRTDIFAFGCVLYEMLTGRRTFDAEDVSETLAAVLMREPDWAALPATPPTVVAVLRRCLQRDPKRRLRDIGDVLLALDGAFEAVTPQTTPAVSKPARRHRLAIAIASTLVLAVLAGATWRFLRDVPAAPSIARFVITLPQGKTLQNTARQDLAISPDGSRIVYASDGRLYSRAIAEFDAREIAGTAEAGVDPRGVEGISSPVFSPDGRSVAFFSALDNTIKRVRIDGGALVTLCPVGSPFGVTWDASGILVGQGDKGILRCPSSGGPPEQLVKVKDGEQAYGPQILPGTDLVLFTVSSISEGQDRWERANIVLQSLSSGTRMPVISRASDARYLRTGHLVYVLGGTVFARSFNPSAPSRIGEPVPVIEGVARTPSATTGVGHFVVSENGTVLYTPGPATGRSSERALGLADRSGAVERLAVPNALYAQVRASRDGRLLAVESEDSKEKMISILRLDGRTALRRLTFGGNNRSPVWSPDGSRLAFQSDHEGDLGIFTQRIDGTGTIDRLTRPSKDEAHTPESWSPDGKTLLLTVKQGSTYSLLSLSIATGRTAPVPGVSSIEPIDSVFSPDGRWIVYHVRTGSLSEPRGPNNGIYIQPFPPTGARYQAPRVQGDFHPVWTPDGRSLVYVPSAASQQMATVQVMTEHGVTFSPPTMAPAAVTGLVISVLPRAYDILPDGRFVGLVSARDYATLVFNGGNQIRVVLNWFEELKQRVPVQ
jgi:Tol biopolymer transport system component